MALQSKTFKSGYSNGFYSQLTVSEDSTNVTTNTSTISYTLSLYSTNMNFSDYSIGYYVKLGGNTLVNVARAGAKQWTLGTNSHIDLYKGTAAIAHDADGSKSMAVEFFISVYPMYYTPGDITVSGQSMALTAIPRATTFSSVPGSVNIGSVCAIKLSRKSAAYTHTITYKFGSLSGTVVSASTSETVNFTVPTTFYAQIPNAASGACTLTCTTYSGSTVIGAAQTASFTAVANVKPTVSGTVVDSNATTKALTGDQNKLVRYYSTAACTISASAGTGATVAAKTVNGLAVSGTTLSIPNVDTGSFLFSVRDSRGATQTATVTKTVVQYVKLTVNGSLTRTAPTASTANLKLSGNYFNASFGTTANTLSVTYKTKPAGGSYGSAVTVTPTKSGNTWSAAVTLSGMAYTDAYTVSVTAADKLGSVTKEFTLTRGTPVFDWGQSDFQFHVPVQVEGGVMTWVFNGEQYSIGSAADIDSALNKSFAAMPDKSVRSILLNVTANGLALGGGIWTVTLFRSTAAYGTVSAVSYGDQGCTYRRALRNSAWSPWFRDGQDLKLATPSDLNAAAPMDETNGMMFWLYTASTLNSPLKASVTTNSLGFGVTVVINTSYKTQICWDFHGIMYRRLWWVTNGWTAWEKAV